MTQPNAKAEAPKKEAAAPTSGDKAEAKPAAPVHFASLGEGVDVSNLVTYGGYHESDTHVPDVHFQYGTLDTSDTAGVAHQNIREISPVFDVGKANAFATAAKALDPEDKTVDPSMVSLPDSTLTADNAKETILGKVTALKDEPIVIGGMTPAQRLAATDEDGNIPEAPKGEDAVEEKPSDATK